MDDKMGKHAAGITTLIKKIRHETLMREKY